MMDYEMRVLRVLADPTRFRIAQLTCEEPQYPRDLAKVLGMTSSAVYQHLNALSEVGFIERVEVENRVHCQAKAGVSEFLQEFGEACERLRQGGEEPVPGSVPGPPQREVSSDDGSIRVQEGFLTGSMSSFLEYYAYSPFWSVAFLSISLIDVLLAFWCLVYAVLYNSNPLLTVVGGMIVCGTLAAVANYLYRRTRPVLQVGSGEG